MIKRRLLGYLDKIKYLNNCQFGFIAGKSTEEALLHFLSHVYEAFNISEKCTALFIDIAKAFDTVDHSILIMKLANIGVRGKLLKWFESNLRNRHQVVKIGDTISDSGILPCGVPQGSVLGPILFLIYFNSIFEINLLGVPTAFADDLVLSYSLNDNCLDAQVAVQRDLLTLSKWFFYHRLIVSDKSRIMNFARGNNVVIPNPLIYHSFTCGGNPCTSLCFALDFVTEFKYLGLLLDYQLNWNSHIDNIKKSVIITIHKFYNLRQICPTYTLRKLYHAFVESLIMYGISCWGGIYFTHVEGLYIAQKRIVKLIYHRTKRTPTIPLFRELNLLPLRYLYVYKVLKMFFIRSERFHSRKAQPYYIRNPNRFLHIRCNTEKFRRFYLFMAPYWFHKLPQHLKLLNTERIHQFKREVRKWLLNIDNIEEFFNYKTNRLLHKI